MDSSHGDHPLVARVEKLTPRAAAWLVAALVSCGVPTATFLLSREKESVVTHRDADDVRSRLAAVEDARKLENASERLRDLEEKLLEMRGAIDRAAQERAALSEKYHALDRFLAGLAIQVDAATQEIREMRHRGGR
ncbi:Hypothetical protein GbCGDNIH3_7036 [Granulibacter bethesdensis]|uniref:Uncharacterized protein n=1 Tax=Granulibacter bethesdensis TaxID=364410 RepID=A0AAN0VFY4_9PROT|nr:hypothetical protein [Granulibacter bethesdensis]AHJ63276.1 Hypothetical protein GbCGDNIH3_7036 [Granulibacter bethesdensis]